MLNARALLAAWETGVPQPLPRRALTLLHAGSPEISEKDWARVSVGERDGRLLELREQLFGDRFEAVSTCPVCTEQVEFSFTTEDVRGHDSHADSETLVWQGDGFDVQFRLPNTDDVLAAIAAPEHERRVRLLDRCLLETRSAGAMIDRRELPETVVAHVVQAMSKADSRADVRVEMSCPSCNHQWSVTFDIASWLWSEVEDWAARLLKDVCRLAYAFGWSEAAILAMSARRRRLYLEMLGD